MTRPNPPSRYRWRKTLVISIALAATVVIPYPTTVCPEWKLQVIDEHGNAVARAAVSEFWRYYSLEEADHEETLCTDGGGTVTFPRRNFAASLLTRVLGAVLELKEMRAHTSIGASAFVIVGAAGYNNHGAHYSRGTPQAVIQVKDHAPETMFPYRKKCE